MKVLLNPDEVKMPRLKIGNLGGKCSNSGYVICVRYRQRNAVAIGVIRRKETADDCDTVQLEGVTRTLKTKNTQGEKKKLLNPWVQNRVVFCSI